MGSVIIGSLKGFVIIGNFKSSVIVGNLKGDYLEVSRVNKYRKSEGFDY